MKRSPIQIVDDLGTAWSVEGIALDGFVARVSLDFVTEWYGWAAYHRATGIYEG